MHYNINSKILFVNRFVVKKLVAKCKIDIKNIENRFGGEKNGWINSEIGRALVPIIVYIPFCIAQCGKTPLYGTEVF